MSNLYLTCINFTISKIGTLQRELLWRQEFKNELQAEKMINDYLLNFDDVKQIKEDSKPNEIKYFYETRHKQSGLYCYIGFNYDHLD